jgi:hypothetical protein
MAKRKVKKGNSRMAALKKANAMDMAKFTRRKVKKGRGKGY